MAAVCVGIVMGVEPQAICDAISNYMPQNNRSQFTKTEKNDLIIDAYNANPTSMKASIENFASLNLPAKMLILGDMRELGADSETEHQKIIDLLNEKGLLNVFLVGECFAKTQHSFASFSNVEELSKYIKKRPISGQTILIKGSNGIKLNSIIPLL
jgi:UDP-N-acetylmuramoyl-tripeptide--D-alanyl-D-alanine ligase